MALCEGYSCRRPNEEGLSVSLCVVPVGADGRPVAAFDSDDGW